MTYAAERVRLNEDTAVRGRSRMIFPDRLSIEQIGGFAQKLSVPAEQNEIGWAGRVETELRASVNAHSARLSVLLSRIVNFDQMIHDGGAVAVPRKGIVEAQMIAEGYRRIAGGGIAVDQVAVRRRSARADLGGVTVCFDLVNIAVIGIFQHGILLLCPF